MVLFVACALIALPARAGEIIYPIGDGTLADGGIFGDYDGVVDSWNWVFGPVGFAGAVTLTTETPASAVEHRMVCKYDLRGVSVAKPLNATLTFTTRGASVLPFPDVTLHVYSFPGELYELPADFSAAPAVLQGVITVAAMQAPKAETVDVTGLVASAITSGNNRVAFRFQIDPLTPNVANQVFIDALDSAPETKPILTVRSAVPGDVSGDGKTDLADFAIFTDCMCGPGAEPAPTTPGITAADCLYAFDHDGDDDVNLDDLSALLTLFAYD
jgi:hypothetical protein